MEQIGTDWIKLEQISPSKETDETRPRNVRHLSGCVVAWRRSQAPSCFQVTSQAVGFGKCWRLEVAHPARPLGMKFEAWCNQVPHTGEHLSIRQADCSQGPNQIGDTWQHLTAGWGNCAVPHAATWSGLTSLGTHTADSLHTEISKAQLVGRSVSQVVSTTCT